MANRFWVGGTGTWDASDTTHWSASTGGAGGQSVPGSSDDVVFDGSSGGGTVTVNTNANIKSFASGSFTGTVDWNANNNNLTAQTFGSSGTGTRALTLGTGTFTITGNNTTIFNFTTTTGLTFSGASAIFDFTYSGSTGTRTIINPGSAIGRLGTVKISAGSDIVAFTTNSLACTDLNFTGFTGSVNNGTWDIAGNLTLGTGMTITAGSGITTFSATSAKTITSNGVNFDRPITFNGISGSWQMQDTLLCGSATARAITLTAGTLNINGKTLTHFGTVTNTGSSTRVLAFGTGGIWDITNTGTATVWNASGSAFTVSGTGTIKISGSTANVRTFAGGGFTYSNIWFTNATANGELDMTGSNTFSDFKCIDTNGQSIKFTAGTTTTVSTFTVAGGVNGAITLTSITTGSHSLVKVGSTPTNCDYLSIQHSIASPSLIWYAGNHSTNNQATVTAGSGWVFTGSPVAPATNSRLSKVVAWEDRIPFAIKTCIKCGRPIQKNVWGYRYCGNGVCSTEVEKKKAEERMMSGLTAEKIGEKRDYINEIKIEKLKATSSPKTAPKNVWATLEEDQKGHGTIRGY